MNIATINLRIDVASDGKDAWKFRVPFLASLFKASDWDVVGTQEGNLRMLADLMPGIPRFSRLGLPRSGEDETCAILYDPSRLELRHSGTFWLSETPERESRFPGSCFLRICTWAEFLPREGDRFRLFNTHLDYVGPEIRTRQLGVLLDRMKGLDAADPLPVFLTGDFNAEPEDPCFSLLRDFRLRGGRSLLSAGDRFRIAGRTFHAFAGEGPGKPIDHVFFSSDRDCVFARIRVDRDREGNFPSDHFPLEARFRP